MATSWSLSSQKIQHFVQSDIKAMRINSEIDLPQILIQRLRNLCLSFERHFKDCHQIDARRYACPQAKLLIFPNFSKQTIL